MTLIKGETSASGGYNTPHKTLIHDRKNLHLFIQEYFPLEVRSEVLDLGADVLLHHCVQRDPELIQLRLQRGQLCSLLQTVSI